MTAIIEDVGPHPPARAPERVIRRSELISALSYALDLTEGQLPGHSVRSCLLGMRIAEAAGLPLQDREDLYYALLLKDAGCSSNASRLYNIIGTDDIKAKRDLKTDDWTKLGWESLRYALDHVQTGRPFLDRVRALVDVSVHNRSRKREMVLIRCERGASIARKIGLSEAAADAIHSLDEHWDGMGHPQGLRGTEIPILSRILNLAQTLDVFHSEHGREEAIHVAKKRSGKWFDPSLVRAAVSAAKKDAFWADLDTDHAGQAVVAMEPPGGELHVDHTTLDNICEAFAEVIDAKSPFTYRHSMGVADAAVSIAVTLSLPASDVALVRRAALLHDIGKLSVPNVILEKPGKLDQSEWEVVRNHPYYTHQILSRIPGFGELTEVAACHHEKLDGSGYYRHMTAEQLSTPARILVVADIFDALAAKRPYRDALPLETVFGIMRKEAPKAIDASCLEALVYANPI